jgi:hypothetical protein
MPRGTSGRVVLEIDPETKRELYATLARQGLTLKAWFLREAQHYIDRTSQPALAFTDEASGRLERRHE